MKNLVNFLSPKFEKTTDTKRKKIVRWGSLIILIVFVVFNLVLFGLYFSLRKNTSDALLGIDREETVIANLSSTESLYRQLKQKLSFLTKIWSEPQKVNFGLIFVNSFMGPEASLEKMNFNQDGLISLNLSSLDSLNLELFLNRSRQAEQEQRIKELKIDSVDKDSAGKDLASDYKFILNFKLNNK